MVDLEEKKRRLELDGWCLIEGIIPAGRVETIRDTIMVSVREHRRPNTPENIDLVSGLINYEQSFAPYLVHSRLLDLCTLLLGQHLRVSFTSCIVNYPGNRRGHWHADWPFNQLMAGHIAAPYPDAVMHMTSIWMLTSFTSENGGTLIVPGSHWRRDNPTGENGIAKFEAYPGEIQITGSPGTILVMDSRLWHATAPNRSDQPRVGLAIRYAPWWLNLNVLLPGSQERLRLQRETGLRENEVPPVPVEVYERLPAEVKPLFEHWVRR